MNETMELTGKNDWICSNILWHIHHSNVPKLWDLSNIEFQYFLTWQYI